MQIAVCNVPATLYRSAGYNRHSETVYGAGLPVKCAVVHFLPKAVASPIRSEASATHGRVEQDTNSAQLLFPPTLAIQQDDRVDLFGVSLVVLGVTPVTDTFGNVDHQNVVLQSL